MLFDFQLLDIKMKHQVKKFPTELKKVLADNNLLVQLIQLLLIVLLLVICVLK